MTFRAQVVARMLTCALALAFAACGGDPHRAPPATDGAVSTLTGVTAQLEPTERFHETTGTVRGHATTTISSKLPGNVMTVLVAAGDRVTAGQLLITLGAGEVSADVRRAAAATEGGSAAVEVARNGLLAAEAQLELATTTRGRYRTLREQKAATQQELDEVEARWAGANAGREMAAAEVRRAESGLEQARQGHLGARAVESYTRLTAPFDGLVLERRVDSGTLATPGAPLLVLADAGAMRIVTSVEESLAGVITVGAPAAVVVASADLEAKARVVEVEPRIDAGSRAFRVELVLDDPTLAARLRPGQFARVRFPVGTIERLLVPAAAVRRRGQLDRVLVLADGQARMRLVTLGGRHGDRLEVLSGLDAGERVVSPWSAGLGDGARATR